MREEIFDRIIEEANYIAETNATVRATAKVFGVSKSSVHKDVTDRLFWIDKQLYCAVRKCLDVNLAERHLRGGMATKNKYLKIKKNTLEE